MALVLDECAVFDPIFGPISRRFFVSVSLVFGWFSRIDFQEALRHEAL
jgi:hypothetical protein